MFIVLSDFLAVNGREFEMTTALLEFRHVGCRTAHQRALRTWIAALLAVVWLALSISAGHCKDRLANYTYKDTQDLVSLVEDAAGLIEKNGDDAFKEFAQRNSKWLNADYYLFAYTLDGTTAFHPLSPELVGQNVMDLKDMNGKQIIRQITNIGRRRDNDASGWVFYLWEDRAQLTPSWKAAYVRKVVTPEHKTYVVGSGSYSIKMEKAFVEERVKRAARYLHDNGKEQAFKRFHSRASSFFFLDSYIFVLNERGETLVGPAERWLNSRMPLDSSRSRVRSKSWSMLTKLGCNIFGPSRAALRPRAS